MKLLNGGLHLRCFITQSQSHLVAIRILSLRNRLLPEQKVGTLDSFRLGHIGIGEIGDQADAIFIRIHRVPGDHASDFVKQISLVVVIDRSVDGVGGCLIIGRVNPSQRFNSTSIDFKLSLLREIGQQISPHQSVKRHAWLGRACRLKHTHCAVIIDHQPRVRFTGTDAPLQFQKRPSDSILAGFACEVCKVYREILGWRDIDG